MKKLFVILILITGFALNSLPVQANEIDELTKGKGFIIYQDSEITVKSFGSDEAIAQAIAKDENTVENVFGSTVSGIVEMNKNNGGVAYLTGAAYSARGDRYKVLPGVHTSF